MAEENNIQTSPKKIRIWRRKNIHLVSEENDIKFRGPLSYRHLRIAGWFFLIVSQLGTILGLASNIGLISVNDKVLSFLSAFSSLMMPLFLLAAFAQVLVAKNGYRRLIITYVGGVVGIYLVFLIVYEHFVMGIMKAVMPSQNAHQIGQRVIDMLQENGSISINIFVDLLLCALVTFFINYRPTKYFQGNKVCIFRAFVAFPILYELASIVVKVLVSAQTIAIPPYIIPLLTTKPPVAFIIFIVMALFVKNRERYYIKKGRTHEDYKEFLKTNVNSLHFSLSLTYTIIFAAILDLVIFLSISAAIVATNYKEGTDLNQLVIYTFTIVSSWGFGKCVTMLFLIPIVILFDYKKTYKDNKMDIIIPVAGVAILVLLYIEGLFEVARAYLIKTMQDVNQEEPVEAAKHALKAIMTRIRK